jgi:hypothetical protein
MDQNYEDARRISCSAALFRLPLCHVFLLMDIYPISPRLYHTLINYDAQGLCLCTHQRRIENQKLWLLCSEKTHRYLHVLNASPASNIYSCSFSKIYSLLHTYSKLTAKPQNVCIVPSKPQHDRHADLPRGGDSLWMLCENDAESPETDVVKQYALQASIIWQSTPPVCCMFVLRSLHWLSCSDITICTRLQQIRKPGA